ncbi:hypothetical protein A3K64_00010 [Candidatus Micrarchaeota archaeon RBG_16_36_9]|nr:MAG: hypothetical protein A3K64_00010 [Candidatus Micrarchaeota archaeon RBG_16_36_9]
MKYQTQTYKAKNVDEVSFANHLNEFIRFYDRHKSLCDQITGVKKVSYIENGTLQEVEIGKSNFLMAIKKLNAFLIDNIHYISSTKTSKRFEQDVLDIETEFMSDSKYHEYLKNESNLTMKEKMDFNITYFKYIFRCFEISYNLFKELQTSLMISTKDIKKSLRYYDFKEFFENLSKYRDEVSNDLADFRFKNVFNHFKKVIGYHYTYRFMVSKVNMEYVDELISIAYSYIMNPKTIDLLTEEDTGNVSEMHAKSLLLKRIFSEIYKVTNKSLSERNILPKIEKKVLIDKTLI